MLMLNQDLTHRACSEPGFYSITSKCRANSGLPQLQLRNTTRELERRGNSEHLAMHHQTRLRFKGLGYRSPCLQLAAHSQTASFLPYPENTNLKPYMPSSPIDEVPA